MYIRIICVCSPFLFTSFLFFFPLHLIYLLPSRIGPLHLPAGCRYEWVNVSSGTGSLGLPGQNPESRKMVVCVCVCWIPNPNHTGIKSNSRADQEAQLAFNFTVKPLPIPASDLRPYISQYPYQCRMAKTTEFFFK